MSYDIDLLPSEEDARDGDRGPNCPDPTYNLTPIFDLALTNEPLPNPEVPEAYVVLFRKPTDRPRGLRVLSGKRAEDTIAQLVLAIERLNDPNMRERFVELEPENKWGTVEDAVYVLERLRDLAIEYPNNTWSIR